MALSGLEQARCDAESVAAVIGVLKQRFADRLQTNDSVRATHAHTMTYIPAQLPDGVVFAQTTEEVAEIVRIAADHKVPVIPFGAGTSLEGGVNAPKGGISIDLSAMNEIIALHEEDFDVSVQAGVTREDLNLFLRDKGLFFPIDPGANASLGGMAATRASGTNAVRYGTMRDNVVNVTVVLADGKVIKTGARARKSSAGYDLTRLFVGSEGTLGVITELTLKLHPVPESISVGISQFPDIESACDATIAALQMGLSPARIELLDQLASEIIAKHDGMKLESRPTLFFEFHGSPATVLEQRTVMGELVPDYGGTAIDWVEEAKARKDLWKARHNAFFAMLAHRPGCKGIVTDACVPLSKLAQCVSETCRDARELELIAPIVGHVGDGNFHISPLVMMDDEDEVKRAEKLVERLNERTIEMEGTCTGEHGIGQGKRRFLSLEHGAGADIMFALKRCLDPDDILNPGKVIADERTPDKMDNGKKNGNMDKGEGD